MNEEYGYYDEYEDSEDYDSGKLDGVHRSWYENGQLKIETTYKDGKFISAKCWDEDGKVIKCPDW